MFRVVAEELVSEDGVGYTGYGIAYSEDAVGEQDAVYVKDISLRRETTEGLARLCNALELPPACLKEVAEDLVCREGRGDG